MDFALRRLEQLLLHARRIRGRHARKVVRRARLAVSDFFRAGIFFEQQGSEVFKQAVTVAHPLSKMCDRQEALKTAIKDEQCMIAHDELNQCLTVHGRDWAKCQAQVKLLRVCQQQQQQHQASKATSDRGGIALATAGKTA